jgi:hypothetical protein
MLYSADFFPCILFDLFFVRTPYSLFVFFLINLFFHVKKRE